MKEILLSQKLFCLPYAGASAAMYYVWKRNGIQVEIVPIELAGRGMRLGEPFSLSMKDIVNDVYNSVFPLLEDSAPYALFGHSMGGFIAFELAHMLQDRGQMLPKALIISGAASPHYSTRNMKSVSQLPNEQLLDYLNHMGGIPSNIVENELFFQMFLPVIRADYKVLEGYHVNPERKKLNLHLSVFYGTKDKISKERMEGWRDYTSGRFTSFAFEGGHFFIHEKREEVIQTIQTVLLSGA